MFKVLAIDQIKFESSVKILIMARWMILQSNRVLCLVVPANGFYSTHESDETPLEVCIHSTNIYRAADVFQTCKSGTFLLFCFRAGFLRLVLPA